MKVRPNHFIFVIPGRVEDLNPESSFKFRGRFWIPGSRAIARAPE